ncbi:MAG TPA: 2-phospho-L-lactate transferase [Sphingopyxis sp.]|nr:2-phospho-L-lactate transferase [Sphingopyxis sp.]
MIIALAGGVGGARLANGLASTLDPQQLLVAVNVGDDFEHLGLTICPDLDTVTYTLAGLNDEVRGWGQRNESWAFMEAIRAVGGADWFALGDRDLATHVFRTEQMQNGLPLSEVTFQITKNLGIAARIVPVSDDPIRSIIETDEGNLPFQHYFVRRQCGPKFCDIRYEGADTARLSPALEQALADPDLEGIVICPSNPILSIGPLLAIPALKAALSRRRVPCVAVSPFIAGHAVKGPAAKIFKEIGMTPGAKALAHLYTDITDAILCDADDPDSGSLVSQQQLVIADTFMGGPVGQRQLADIVLSRISEIGSEKYR